LQLGKEKEGKRERSSKKLRGPGTEDHEVLSAGPLITLWICTIHHLHRVTGTILVNVNSKQLSAVGNSALHF